MKNTLPPGRLSFYNIRLSHASRSKQPPHNIRLSHAAGHSNIRLSHAGQGACFSKYPTITRAISDYHTRVGVKISDYHTRNIRLSHADGGGSPSNIRLSHAGRNMKCFYFHGLMGFIEPLSP